MAFASVAPPMPDPMITMSQSMLSLSTVSMTGAEPGSNTPGMSAPRNRLGDNRNPGTCAGRLLHGERDGQSTDAVYASNRRLAFFLDRAGELLQRHFIKVATIWDVQVTFPAGVAQENRADGVLGHDVFGDYRPLGAMYLQARPGESDGECKDGQVAVKIWSAHRFPD